MPADGPVSWTAREDAAEAATVVLASNGGYDGPVTLTASSAPTFAEVAAMASELTGRTIDCVTVDEDQWVAAQVAAGQPEPVARFTHPARGACARPSVCQGPGMALRDSSGMRWGHLAASWAALFAVLHLSWAAGGSWLLASSAGTELAETRPLWFVLVGLAGVAVVLTAGAVLGLALARRLVSGRAARLLSALSCFVGAGLLLRGVAVEVVLLTDAGGVATTVGAAQTRLTLALWNPWFAFGGLAFLAAGVQGRRDLRRPDR